MSEVEDPDLARPVEELVAELRALRAEREAARRAGDLESIRVVPARVILDEIDQFTGLLGAHGILLEANEAALDGARLRREDVIGRPFWEARWWRADPEGVEWLKGAVGRAFSGEVVRREVDVPTSTGAGVVTVDFTIQPVRDPRGRVEFLLAKGRDVTEKVRAEAAPHQDHAMLRAVIEGIDDAIFAKDRSGRYLLVNSAGARRIGRAVEDILGRDDTELFDPETARRIRDDDLRIMREAITLTREETGQAAGVTRVYLATKWPNRDAQGRIIGVLGISRDVTERLQAEEALRQGEANYRLLADNVTDIISRHDADGRFLYASPACRTLLGYELRELIGRLSHEFIHRDDLPRVAQARAAMRGEDSGPRTIEYRIRRKDGGYTWVETASRLVHGEAAVSEPEELWVSRDVTERKRAEEALRRSESILRSFYDSAPMRMGVVDVLDDDIRFVSANATVVEHLRPATGDPRGRCARDLGVPEDHIAAWIRHLRESERTGLPIRFEMRAGPVGEGLWFSNTVRFITRDADGTPRFSFISEDITERKRTEEALIEWKGRYEAAIQARGEILYDYDVTTGEMTYGGTFEEVLGYSAEDLVDGLARWIELIHPEDRAAFDKESRHALDTRGPFSLEYRVRCRDGSSIVVQDDGRLFTDATGRRRG